MRDASALTSLLLLAALTCPATALALSDSSPAAGACKDGATYPVSLTFDDGPAPGRTDRVLDVLNKHGIQATFFVLGETFTPLARHPAHHALLDRMVREGHTIGTHTYHHVPHNFMTAAQATLDIARAGQEIAQYLAPILRLPGGDGYYEMWNTPPEQKIRDHQVMQIVRDQGYVHVGWDIQSNDTVAERRPFIRQSILSQICAYHGGVVLMHDIQEFTVRSLEDWITAIEAAGHPIVPLSEFVPEARLKWSDVDASLRVCTPQLPVNNHGAPK